MAEKSCRLLLELAPHNLTVLWLMTEALLDQNRFEEAQKIGGPAIKLVSILGKLPEGISIHIIRKLAAYLSQQNDFAATARLWESGTRCAPEAVDVKVEWIKSLWLSGEQTQARQVLSQLQAQNPQNSEVLNLLDRFTKPVSRTEKKHRH